MKIKNNNQLLGAHMSIAGGLEKSIELGASIGCNTIQIFTKSSRQWDLKPLTEKEILLFKETKKKYPTVNPIIAHCSYLVNIGSPTETVAKKSITTLIAELNRCDALEIPYLVLHPGSALDSSKEICITQIAKNLDHVFSKNTGPTMILLETMAGQGSTIGTTFQELAEIRAKTKLNSRIGICLDTCHVFQAGYRFFTPKEYANFWHEFDKAIGLEYLKAIHINDSKREFNQHVDRHETIGDGHIGLEAFKLLMHDKKLAHIPKILETPKLSIDADIKNMNTLLNL